MRAGRLRHRIRISEPVHTRTAAKTINTAWSPFAERWAEILPESGREFAAARQMLPETEAVIRIRGPLAVKPDMRVEFDSKVYDILAVVDVEMRGQELRLICKEGTRQGN